MASRFADSGTANSGAGMAEDADSAEQFGFEALPEPTVATPSHARVVYGRVIPPQQQILLFSAEEWEEFINEWAHAKRRQYTKVVKLSAANDMGIDVAGLTDEKGFFGVWDNFQCKHYDDPLTPGIALPEIGKMLWYAFTGCFSPPRSYAFMAPKNCGPSLKRLLLNASALKFLLFERWEEWCRTSITQKQAVELTGKFREYCEAFNYGIFTFRPTLDVIEEHRQTPYFGTRFGGGLPDRPTPDKPPAEVEAKESRYIQKLYAAYGEHTKTVVSALVSLKAWPKL